MSRIFWDTNLFIYLLEDYGALSKRVAGGSGTDDGTTRPTLYVHLELGEILVKPARPAMKRNSKVVDT